MFELWDEVSSDAIAAIGVAVFALLGLALVVRAHLAARRRARAEKELAKLRSDGA